MLGSNNRANPFAYPLKLPDGRVEIHDVSTRCLANLATLDLHGLVVVGGDGTMSFAQKFIDRGATRIVGVPKTIDNDLEATDYTVGFQTAVEIVVEAIERLHTTAESHDRIIIVEVMGRYAGWIALDRRARGRRAHRADPRDRVRPRPGDRCAASPPRAWQQLLDHRGRRGRAPEGRRLLGAWRPAMRRTRSGSAARRRSCRADRGADRLRGARDGARLHPARRRAVRVRSRARDPVRREGRRA